MGKIKNVPVKKAKPINTYGSERGGKRLGA